MKQIRSLLFLFSIEVLLLPVLSYGQTFEGEAGSLISDHRGDVAVAIKNLKTGFTFLHRADVPQATASLIKFPIMVSAYRAAERDAVSLDDRLILREEDKVPGSGLLRTHFSSGTEISLRDAIRLMIAFSDNTATNMILDRIGLATTNEVMEALGFRETRLHSKVFRRDTRLDAVRSERFGLGSTTADEMVRLLSELYNGSLCNGKDRQAMLEHLLACDDERKVRRFLPPEIKLYHKTGSVDRVRCDAGIMETASGPVVFCLLTERNEDSSWGDSNQADLLCAELGKLMHAHFNAKLPSAIRIENPKLGSSGVLVRALQQTLKSRLKLDNFAIDGEYGPATEAAVKAFQRAEALEVTGEPDRETWKRLGPLVLERELSPVSGDSQATVKQPAEPLDGPPIVTCQAWTILDGETGDKLFDNDGNKLLDPASTTKMMTALLVVEAADREPNFLDEIIVFSKRADATIGSTSDLWAGEKVSVRELLYGLMLPSGNDASVALAEHFGHRLSPRRSTSSSHDLFVEAMNLRAKELKLENTSYKNPHGLTNDKHKSTANDLAKLAQHALKNSLFREIVATPRHSTVVQSELGYSRSIIWENTNRLLGIEGYDGVKTGTTDAAGACLVSSCHRNDRHLIIVVLGSKSSEARYADTRNLFRWAWKQTTVKP